MVSLKVSVPSEGNGSMENHGMDFQLDLLKDKNK